jgi:tRNA(fMet)-specific endonuclease VapC
MILLDTDHVTHLQWGGTPAERIARRLQDAGLDIAATTIISYEEHVRGWLARLSTPKSVLYEVEIYAKLRQQYEFYQTLEIEDFTEYAAVEYQRLRHIPVRIGTKDLKVAAIALVSDALLLTKNLRDFRKVPGLRVEDATA